MTNLLILVLALLPLSTIALSTSNTTVNGLIQACLPQAKAGETQVPEAVYEDCIKIILGFTTGLRPKEPALFSRETWTGVHMPQKGVHGNCVFEIDMFKDATDEFASTFDVAREAGKMAKECVLKAPRTGGVAVVGKHNRIEIILHGLTAVDLPKVMAGWEHLGCEAATNTTILAASMTDGPPIVLETCAKECRGYQYFWTRFGTQ